MNASAAKSIFESALVELADPSDILVLIRGYAADGRPYDGQLSQALRKVALGQRSVEGWITGAYEEFSVSLAELRRALFAMVRANNAQSALAAIEDLIRPIRLYLQTNERRDESRTNARRDRRR